MEILFWLAPAAVATAVAMVWVGWWGREGRGEVDRETAARRLGEALSREQVTRPGYAVARRDRDRASGVALRPSKMRPVVLPAVADPSDEKPEEAAAKTDESADRRSGPDRRAS